MIIIIKERGEEIIKKMMLYRSSNKKRDQDQEKIRISEYIY